MAQSFSLEILKGPSQGQKINFEKEIVNIGRSAVDNDLILNNQSVSVDHARISFVNGFFFLQDMGSTNGTTINGLLLGKNERVKLENDSAICCGSICLQFTTKADLVSPARNYVQIDKTFIQKDNNKQFIRKQTSSSPHKIIASGFKKKRITIACICVCVFFLFALIFLIKEIDFTPSSNSGSVAELADHFNDPISLPADKSYGYLPKSIADSRKDKVVFSFIVNSGSVFLYYTPGYINSVYEVTISVNGENIGYIPITGDSVGEETVVYIPRNLLHSEKNFLEFDNTLNPPGDSTWGIKKIYIKLKTEFSCDVDEAKRLLDLGNSAYEEKSISTCNLFIALQYYSDALLYLDVCTPLPVLYLEISNKLLKVKTELMDQYSNFMFLNTKARKLNDKKSQIEVLEKILLLIPDKKDPRYINAADEMEKIQHLSLDKKSH